jgi:hypothetical protein
MLNLVLWVDVDVDALRSLLCLILFSVFFICKNSFYNNCPNALNRCFFFFFFINFENNLPNTFLTKNGFIFLFSKTVQENKNKKPFAKYALFFT